MDDAARYFKLDDGTVARCFRTNAGDAYVADRRRRGIRGSKRRGLGMAVDWGMTEDGMTGYRAIRAFKPLYEAVGAGGFGANERVRASQRLGVGDLRRAPYTLERCARRRRSVLPR